MDDDVSRGAGVLAAGLGAENLDHVLPLEVFVGDDALEGFAIVRGDFRADAGTIERFLRALGLGGPLDPGGVQALMNGSAADAPVRVVAGRAPVHGSDEAMRFRFESLNAANASSRAESPEGAAVDHRDVKTVERCNSGDLLVERWREREAEDGVDAYGRAIPAGRGRSLAIVPGVNVVLSADGLRLHATCVGVPMRDGAGRISVHPVLTLPRVDFKSGNVAFDGAVLVEGDVLAGFSIDATGHVDVRGMLEQATVRSGGNVTVRGGVRQRSVIRAAGDVTLRFVDSNSEIHACGTLRVLNDATQSRLSGLRAVVVGGRVTAGDVHSHARVEAAQIGSPDEAVTRIEVVAESGVARIDALRTQLYPPTDAGPSLVELKGVARVIAPSGRSTPSDRTRTRTPSDRPAVAGVVGRIPALMPPGPVGGRGASSLPGTARLPTERPTALGIAVSPRSQLPAATRGTAHPSPRLPPGNLAARHLAHAHESPPPVTPRLAPASRNALALATPKAPANAEVRAKGREQIHSTIERIILEETLRYLETLGAQAERARECVVVRTVLRAGTTLTVGRAHLVIEATVGACWARAVDSSVVLVPMEHGRATEGPGIVAAG